MSTCPCCSDRLLRHFRQGSLYWFCRTCWSEMPNLEQHGRTPVAEVAPLPSLLLLSTAVDRNSHFAKVIQHQRPGKTHHLLVG